MRRLLCAALAALMLTTLAACESGGSPEATEKATEQITESVPKTENLTNEPTVGSHDILSLDFIQTFDQNPTMDEQPVYEKDGVTVTAKALRYDTVSGPQIMLSIRNDTENDYLIQNNYTTVNGFMIRPELDVTVKKHKKIEAPMSLPYLSLAMANIHTLKDIGFSLRLLDSKSFAVAGVTPIVKLKLKNTAEKLPPYNENGQTAFDEKGVKIVLQGVKKDSLFESSCVLKVYMVNNTDQTVCIKNNRLAVNGYDITVSMNTPILPGMRAVDKIELYDRDLEEYGVTVIDNVKVSFEIYEYEEWKLIASSKLVTTELPTEIAAEEAETPAPTQATK